MRPRFAILILLIPLGWWLFVQARSSWLSYWILHDGESGTAVLTKEYWGGHGRVVYRYVVNDTPYTGVSSKDWKDETRRNAKIGEGAVVYYSASHPWLSLLYKPDGFIDVLPAVIALALFSMVAVTAVRPKSKWALTVETA